MQSQLAHLDRLRKETAALKARQEAAARDQLAALAESARKTNTARINDDHRFSNADGDEQAAENEALKQQAAEESRRLQALKNQRAEQERELDRLRKEMAKLAETARAQETKPPARTEPAHMAAAPAARETLAETARAKPIEPPAPRTRTEIAARPSTDASATPGVAIATKPRAAPDYRNAAQPNQNTAGIAAPVPQNPAEAARYYRQAAEQGDAQAQLALARLYARGQGVPKDEFFAYVWYAVAAKAGNPAAEAERKYLVRALQPVQLKQAEPLIESILAKFKTTAPAPTAVGSYAHRR
jgi:TPR repeat protein